MRASPPDPHCYCERFSLSLYGESRGAAMILCVCNALREADVRAAVRSGATCPMTAYKALGSKPKCGTCVPAARTIVNEERAAA